MITLTQNFTDSIRKLQILANQFQGLLYLHEQTTGEYTLLSRFNEHPVLQDVALQITPEGKIFLTDKFGKESEGDNIDKMIDDFKFEFFVLQNSNENLYNHSI